MVSGRQTPVAWEFYDLRRDPEELVNRYGDPAYAAIIAALKNELAAQRQQLGESDRDYPLIQSIIDEFWDSPGDKSLHP